MPRLKKILVKVIRNDDIKWVHFCYVSANLYDEFFKATRCEKSEFGAFLSMWVQGDFGEKMSMAYFNDLIRLKYLVNLRYQQEYSELYALAGEENPKITGWVRMWVSQHMRLEIAARKEGSIV